MNLYFIIVLIYRHLCKVNLLPPSSENSFAQRRQTVKDKCVKEVTKNWALACLKHDITYNIQLFSHVWKIITLFSSHFVKRWKHIPIILSLCYLKMFNGIVGYYGKMKLVHKLGRVY